MIVLGIESSCDETAASLVNDKREVLSHVVSTQIKKLKEYGGVVPEISARAHLDLMDDIVEQALKEANLTLDDVDGVAATCGPGLIGGLLVGTMTAKAIAASKDIPFIAVNHLEGHALTPRLTNNVEFPFLLLLISGGHCQFVLAKSLGQYDYLGGTLDDSCGEAFDKVAKMMDLPYPGGPQIEKLAATGNPKAFDFPRPLKGRDGCDFSFSGLKTAVREVIQKQEQLSDATKADISASFQSAVAECLEDRLKHAIEQLPKDVTNFVLAGGVAANQYIRERLDMACKNSGLQMTAPPVSLCTDNAAMIAWVGVERLSNGLTSQLDFNPRPRWPLSELGE